MHGSRVTTSVSPVSPPAAEDAGRLPDRNDLRVRRGIVVYLPAVTGPGYDGARLIEDDGADRYVLRFGPGHTGADRGGLGQRGPGLGRFREREPHRGLENRYIRSWAERDIERALHRVAEPEPLGDVGHGVLRVEVEVGRDGAEFHFIEPEVHEDGEVTRREHLVEFII